jgi:CRP-like cAMP-binding protein
LHQQRLRRGQALRPNRDSVLLVLDGVIALSAVHGDGAEVLLGLYGPGQVLVDHPSDHCDLAFIAQTEANVALEDWEEAVRSKEFADKLRRRLRMLEAWSAMQAHPYLEERILGILALLGEEFGRAHEDGTVIEVRLTHAQVAAAVGAARTSVTRAIGRLKRQGHISIHRGADGERFCVRTHLVGGHG